MKKSIIILIGLIYVASVVFIGFFGMKMAVSDPPIYAEKLTCINEGIYTITDNGVEYKFLDFHYIDGAPKEENVVQITYRITPNDITTRGAKFVCRSEKEDATVTNSGLVFINKKNVTIIVDIISYSRESITDTIYINVL